MIRSEEMPTIKDKLYFNYNGVSSKDFGLKAVDLSSGLYEETFVASRNIEETKPSGRATSIFHGITEEDRSFELILAFDNGFTEDKLESIMNWIFTDYYKPLYFDNNSDRVVFAMMTGDSNIVHNGMQEGYFTVNVKTNSPYIYSNLKSESFNQTAPLKITNNGHEDTYPYFKIEKIGDGDLKINVGGYNVLIANLKNGENIEIDTLREIIKTDLVGQYRYDNVRVGELGDLMLKKGEQTYSVEGDANISLEYREVYKF